MSSPKEPNSKTIVFRSQRWEKDHKKKRDFGEKDVVCRIKEICQSCQYVNDDYQKGLDDKYSAGIKILDESGALDGAQTTPALSAPRSLGYRTHAKLAVRPSKRKGTKFAIGLFKPSTHEVVELDNCPLHRSSINSLLRDLKPLLEESNLEPFQEDSHSGDLRYLAIRASHLTEELMLTFVCTSERPKRDIKGIGLQLRNMGHNVVSLHVNINDEQGNHIFGPTTKRILGAERLREELCKLSFEISPASFFQINPWQAEQIYRRIERLTGASSDQQVAWDLYCGTGQISMVLSRLGYRTVGIEENPNAIRDAQRNATRNDLDFQPQFITGRVEDVTSIFPSWAQSPQWIVVNPSRKGLSESVRQFLKPYVESKHTSLIYVSCDVSTFARDLKDFKESGRRIVQIESFDMFPFTNKMEWLAVIT